MPQIGIVVPLYNGERYLAATLESVLAQAFIEWELVVVDDGSNDRSGAIADAFASRDPRIRLIRQPNSGVARARNAGLHALANGCEFVTVRSRMRVALYNCQPGFTVAPDVILGRHAQLQRYPVWGGGGGTLHVSAGNSAAGACATPAMPAPAPPHH